MIYDTPIKEGRLTLHTILYAAIDISIYYVVKHACMRMCVHMHEAVVLNPKLYLTRPDLDAAAAAAAAVTHLVVDSSYHRQMGST